VEAKQWSGGGEDGEDKKDLELSSEEKLIVEVGGGRW